LICCLRDYCGFGVKGFDYRTPNKTILKGRTRDRFEPTMRLREVDLRGSAEQ